MINRYDLFLRYNEKKIIKNKNKKVYKVCFEIVN